MGRYLQAFKEEGRALVGRRSATQSEQPPPQPYCEERRPQHYHDQEPTGQMTRGDFQAALEQARRQEREDMIARMDASHHAHADRLAQVALAAVNRQNTPVEIRYRGSAYDKKERRFGELKFALIAVAILAALVFIFWVKDQIASYTDPSPGYVAHAPMNHPNRPAHYKHSEEWDDR